MFSYLPLLNDILKVNLFALAYRLLDCFIEISLNSTGLHELYYCIMNCMKI